MAIVPIIIAPDPRLKVVSEIVERVDDRLRKLMDDMLETMYQAPGIGLSAIQAGVPRRVIVIDIGADTGVDRSERNPIKLINPEILWRSDDLALHEEGCLSLPEHYGEVERPARIRLRYLDPDNREQELDADALLSRCIQHEMDHLEGILFVDHLSMIRRGIILRKLVKTRKSKALKSA